METRLPAEEATKLRLYSDKGQVSVSESLLGFSTRTRPGSSRMGQWCRSVLSCLPCDAPVLPQRTDPTFTLLLLPSGLLAPWLPLVGGRAGSQAWLVYCGFPSCEVGPILNPMPATHSAA